MELLYIYIYTSTMFHHFHFRKFCRFAEVERASSSCLPHCFDWRFSQGSSQLQPRSTSRCPGPCFLICIECRYVGICRLLFFPGPDVSQIRWATCGPTFGAFPIAELDHWSHRNHWAIMGHLYHSYMWNHRMVFAAHIPMICAVWLVWYHYYSPWMVP